MTTPTNRTSASNPNLEVIKETLPVWGLLIVEGIIALFVQILNLFIASLVGELSIALRAAEQLIYVILFLTIVHLTVLHLKPILKTLGAISTDLEDDTNTESEIPVDASHV